MIDRLMTDHPSAELLDRLLRVRETLAEINFQLRQAEIPTDWRESYQQVTESAEQVATSVESVFQRFQQLLSGEHK